MNIKVHTTETFADLHGLTEERVRYHCRMGNIDGAIKVPGSGQGCWLIEEGSVIVKKKVGRSVGWRKDKS
jgi:hypothetical protein